MIPEAEWVQAAMKWRDEHPDHVKKLMGIGGLAYPPEGSDALRPELWRAPHWLWLKYEHEKGG